LSCVSIPPWFDFALERVAFDVLGIPVSIPPWFDFAHEHSKPANVRVPRFQSHLGSILPRLPSWKTTSYTPVSIPPWFDFAELRIGELSDTHELVSIPPWFDFALSVWLPSESAEFGFNPTLVRFCPEDEQAVQMKVEFGFNPTLVRFCLRILRELKEKARRFNPTLVRFCHAFAQCDDSRAHGFNPTLVRFCPSVVCDVQRARGCFNPTLVRFCR